jgi:hypothetical protein
VARKVGPTLETCVLKFEEQRTASLELAKFAADYSTLYWELQQERTTHNLKELRIRVQFLGRSLYLERRIGRRMRKVSKIQLPGRPK